MNRAKYLAWIYLVFGALLLLLSYHSWSKGHISYKGVRILEGEPLFLPVLIGGLLGGTYLLLLSYTGLASKKEKQ